ncbi:AtpZ/AtpI family protein [Patescibacteria group bacterium]|nr:AtpZ/AtpI family protein [Patescibacteria group bacterium]MBU1895996.1 AtpZ/AtpI family protein [Patescibacteria group bacterium]
MKVTKDQKYIMFGLKIVGDFGMTIAVPVVLFAYIGNRLDLKYDTGPWLTSLGFVLAALITSIIVYRKAKRYGKEYDSIENNKAEEIHDIEIEDLNK